MKKTLLALALFAFAGTSAFAHEGHDKDGKKGKKEACTAEAKSHCTKEMAGGKSGCCMKGKAAAATDTKAAAPVKSM